MIPGERESFLLSRIKGKDMKALLDWFDELKNSFYKLAGVYLENDQNIKEVFYQTTQKVAEKIPQLKDESYFEAWVTSLFLEECRKLAAQENAKQPAHTLSALGMQDKETVALVYLKELTPEEAAYILKVPVETVKARMNQGIESLSERYGKPLNGCGNYKTRFIDYLGRNMDRHEKIDLEMHLHTCQDCGEELAAYQETILALTGDSDDLNIPPGFMEEVKSRVEATEEAKRLKKRKRSRFGLAAAGIVTFLICTGFVTNSFSHIYYSWVGWKHHEDEMMITYLKTGLGEPLDLEEVSNGVKIKIKTAVSDDVQTLIYYEIEDMEGENRYMVNPHEGVRVENEFDILDRSRHHMYYSPFGENELESEDKNVFKGKLSLAPITSESGTIELKITGLQKIIPKAERNNPTYYEDLQFAEGEWSFKIPVTKQSSFVHELDQEQVVEGIPLMFEKLTIAPTATVLEYSFKTPPGEKRIHHITMESLETNKGTAEATPYGGAGFMGGSGDWATLQASFETLYFEKPEELKVHVGPFSLFIENQKTIDIDMSKGFPQTFEYLGKDLTIEYVKPGDPTKIEISNDIKKNKEFERLEFHVVTEDRSGMTMGGSGDGVLIDKHGNIHDPHEPDFNHEEIEHPRYIQTTYIFEMANEYSDEQVIPTDLEIFGYNTTLFTDETVDISLE